MVCRCFSFSKGVFSGSMFVLGGVLFTPGGVVLDVVIRGNLPVHPVVLLFWVDAFHFIRAWAPDPVTQPATVVTVGYHHGYQPLVRVFSNRVIQVKLAIYRGYQLINCSINLYTTIYKLVTAPACSRSFVCVVFWVRCVFRKCGRPFACPLFSHYLMVQWKITLI